MNRQLIFLILFTVLISHNIWAYAENYQLEIDKNSFEINYFTEGNVIAMAIDEELTSLLVGLENVQNDSLFYIEFPHELISDENNAFAVLVNGLEVDYSISTTDLNSKLSILIPAPRYGVLRLNLRNKLRAVRKSHTHRWGFLFSNKFISAPPFVLVLVWTLFRNALNNDAYRNE